MTSIRRANRDDIPAILELRRERAEWLASIGSDQWQVGLTEDGFVQRVSDSVQAGETWVAVAEDGAVIGTIAIDTWTNPNLWSQAELDDAVILHRMITRRDASGQGLGAALLEVADRAALEVGRRWLRLDAWTTNTGLHRFYEAAGFRHVRTVENHPSRSTALFEREAALLLPSTMQRRYDDGSGGARHGDNPIPPSERCVVDGLSVRRPPRFGDHTTVDLTAESAWHLWWEADAWRLAPAGHGGRNFTYPRDLDESVIRVAAWQGMPALSKEHEYVMRLGDGGAELVVAPRLAAEAP